MDLRENEMEELYYIDGNRKVYISKGHASKLRILRKFVASRPMYEKLDPDFAWKLNSYDFNTFRMNQWSSDNNPITPLRTSAPSNSSSPASISVTRPKTSAVEMFRRGIKRDPSLFPTL